ncbi:MAG: hypothetical protein KGZ68_11015 [Dechloromonas sp.]|nr:hypothetical protein [Dechloromonas sp.]
MSKSDRRGAKKIINDELARMVKHGGISAIKSARRANLTGQKSDQKLTLSDYEIALITESADVPGRLSEERAALLLAGIVISAEPAQWSIHHVRVRLKEAARGCERIVGRVGPRADRGFWPATITEWADKVSRLSGAGRPVTEIDAAGDEHDVARIEEAIQWPMRYLSKPGLETVIKTVQMWMWCEAVDEAFQDFYKGLGASRRTAYRRLDDGFRQILDGVIADGVDL